MNISKTLQVTSRTFIIGCLAFLGMSLSAWADDGKRIPGLMCQGSQGFSTPGLKYTLNGSVANFSYDQSLTLQCVIIRDELVRKSGGGHSLDHVTVHYANNNPSDHIRCTIRSKYFYGGGTLQKSGTSNLLGTSQLTLNGIGGRTGGYYQLECSLPKRVIGYQPSAIFNIYSQENS